MSRTHTPKFFVISEAEQAHGYSSRCQTCGQLLLAGIEFIGSPCPGSTRPATHAFHLDVICRSCGYDGPAPLLSIEETDYFKAHWTVVCPVCSRAWVVDLPEHPVVD